LDEGSTAEENKRSEERVDGVSEEEKSRSDPCD